MMASKLPLGSSGRSLDGEGRSLLEHEGEDEKEVASRRNHHPHHHLGISPINSPHLPETNSGNRLPETKSYHPGTKPRLPTAPASSSDAVPCDGCASQGQHWDGCSEGGQHQGGEGPSSSHAGNLTDICGKESEGGGGGGYVVYTERWYILAMYSMFVFMQSCVWNTWGPIEDTAIAVLGWDAGQIALLANWGPIMYVISAFLFTWLLHAKGLRSSILLTGVILFTGVGVRCIPVPVHMMIWPVHVGHICIGLAGPMCMGAVTSISATWFPSNERTTATALSSMVAVLGVATSFLISPLIVGEVNPSNMTTTTVLPLTTSGTNSTPGFYYVSGSGDDSNDVRQERIKEIRLLLLIEFILTGLVFLAAVIYFPAAPPTPPTASAETKREDMKAGMIAVVKKISFWIPALAYGIMTGAYNAWASQITIIFQDEIDQDAASWLGFYTNLAALIGGVVAGRCADYLGGKMKAILLVLMVACSCCLLWTILLVNQFIPYNTASIFTSVILFGLFLNSTVPLFFEISVEGAFPVGEETTTMLMTWLNNVYALVFLTLPMIPSLNKDLSWLNWVMLGSAVICIPLILFYKEHYNRLEFDVAHQHDNSGSAVTHPKTP